jgi:hypothetical protein
LDFPRYGAETNRTLGISDQAEYANVAAGSFTGGRVTSVIGDTMAAPIFLLAPPRCFTSVVCAMLGQHPQMYGFPETQLFTSANLAQQWGGNLEAKYRIRHGLLRVVAQLYFGEQTEVTVKLARGWLRRRAHFNTGFVFELLAQRVSPLIPVEKSTDVVYHIDSLHRMYGFFPQARFIHLLRHPRGHGESNVSYYRKGAEQGRPPHLPWLFRSHLNIRHPTGEGWRPLTTGILDPQHGWYVHNKNILKFLESVPDDQQMRVRAEDLLTDPDRGLKEIADWMGLRTDDEAIEAMKHPERSPYALIGPPGARWGNSGLFLENPVLRPDRVKPQSLEGALSWLEDGQGFLPAVKQLAREFGYT